MSVSLRLSLHALCTLTHIRGRTLPYTWASTKSFPPNTIKLLNMKLTQFAVLITGVLGTVAMANPVAVPELNPVEVAPRAKYTVKCEGGMHPDARCTNGKKKDGCRCDSKGTYLCDPSSLAKKGGQCAKCGCHAEYACMAA
ncbi:unnamed protein product [Penicillium discolor]